MAWNPYSISDWATAAGLANIPWLSPGAHELRKHSAVLLDGSATSFAIASGGDLGFAISARDPLSWAWSSHLRHLLILQVQTASVLVRRWDTPNEYVRHKIPESPAEMDTFVDQLGRYRPRAPDVVSQMIVAFKSLRAAISVYKHYSNVAVVKAFNLLVAAMEQDKAGLERCRSLADVLSLAGADGDGTLSQFASANIEETIGIILHASPKGIPPLEPRLLIRHASGQLYQEAHFELERQSVEQFSLWGGLAPSRTTRGTRQRDARFTPNALARTLVEQGLRQMDRGLPLTILDPACGSGVFLHETLRELEAAGCTQQVVIRGFDSSEVSIEIAQFCLTQAATDAEASGMKVTVDLKQVDALDEDWGTPSAVFMNPPFVSYRDMDGERDKVKGILGNLAKGHYDKSMAFVWKAAKAVAAGGVLASVIPSVFLDSSNGESWRSALLNAMEMCAVGRFRGYSYFPGAMVEPAFIVMSKRASDRVESDRPLTVLIADEGVESKALRAMRKGTAWAESSVAGIFLSTDRSRASTTATSWLPKSVKHESLIQVLDRLPTVEMLFDVNQGALTGNNDIFVIAANEFLDTIPPAERAYFRPAAGTATIVKGMIERSEFVFFPYDKDGLQLKTEDELKAKVPAFYEKRLAAGKSTLQRRSDKTEKWWELIRARTWQWTRKPKIVTAYFGTSGHFAYDSTGEFACLHGYAWHAKREQFAVEVDTDEGIENVPSGFYDTDLPWAFTAILNSRPFVILLSYYCTQVQGGQFNLSKRFVKDVPLPDLMDEVPGDITTALAECGRAMGSGQPHDDAELSSLVSRAYGVPLSRWKLDT